MTRLASEAAPLGSRAELRAVGFDQAKPASFYAAAGQNCGIRFILSGDSQQRAEARTGSPADPARLANSGTNAVRPAFRDASGLDDRALDQLLGDDFDQLSSAGGKAGLERGTAGITGGLDHTPAMEAGGGAAVSGSFPSLGQGLQGPSTPFLPDAQNGGLTGGGGGGGSAQAPAGSVSSTPNLITGGHFATGLTQANPHGTIVPYTSSAVWPSYTPPSSGGSGGGPPIDTVNSGSGGSDGGATGGINNSNNGDSGGTPSGGGPITSSGGGTTTSSGGGTSGGGPSGGGPSGGCNCGCSGDSGGDNIASARGAFMIDNAPGVADHSISSASEYSPAGVRYFDGQINQNTTDLGTTGFGSLWDQTRSWSNGTPPSSFNGTGVIDMDRPYLLRPNGDNSQIVVVSSATEARFYNLVGSNYVPQFFVQDQLTHNTSTGEFLLTDTMGDTIHFWDWTASQANEQGQFKSCTDADGNTISVTSYTSDGKVAEMQRTDGTTTQSYVYTYLASPDPNAGEISNVTLRQKVNNGSWTIVRQAGYDYYDGCPPSRNPCHFSRLIL